MVCSFVAKSKSNGVGFDGGLFFVTAIGDEPGITMYGSDLLLLSAYAPSMPPLLSLPLSMARDEIEPYLGGATRECVCSHDGSKSHLPGFHENCALYFTIPMTCGIDAEIVVATA
ncbi:hypothetical protein Tco_0876724 [Tanacetum coccineum]|uniref:Uncharacterized protein n=1 Tax=Tanacetum coccineum TaxID=301880 RepID=A0ABQ5BWK4_9ASTR